MNIERVYKKLYDFFGPQGWWPVFDTNRKKCMYGTHPKNDRHDFEICLGAILTQNTAWTNVEKALANLYEATGDGQVLTPEKIKSLKNLEECIRPAGYYNQKAKKIRLFIDWFKEGKTASRKELLDLWGVGKETADSMLLYAFRQPVFVIDNYTKRLCREFGVEFTKYDDYQSFFESGLPRKHQLFNQYHALIVAWGKLYSTDKEQAIKIIK